MFEKQHKKRFFPTATDPSPLCSLCENADGELKTIDATG